ncbi:MAG: hypothetical protein AB4426_10980 [Xenococcaceae cyanobacterium]
MDNNNPRVGIADKNLSLTHTENSGQCPPDNLTLFIYVHFLITLWNLDGDGINNYY